MHLRSYKRAACLIQLDLVGGSHAKPNQVAFAILIIDGGFLLQSGICASHQRHMSAFS